jgi:hypothetical protein
MVAAVRTRIISAEQPGHKAIKARQEWNQGTNFKGKNLYSEPKLHSLKLQNKATYFDT